MLYERRRQSKGVGSQGSCINLLGAALPFSRRSHSVIPAKAGGGRITRMPPTKLVQHHSQDPSAIALAVQVLLDGESDFVPDRAPSQ